MTEKSNDIETKNETKNQPKRLGNDKNDKNHLMIDRLAAANAVSGGGFFFPSLHLEAVPAMVILGPLVLTPL